MKFSVVGPAKKSSYSPYEEFIIKHDSFLMEFFDKQINVDKENPLRQELAYFYHCVEPALQAKTEKGNVVLYPNAVSILFHHKYHPFVHPTKFTMELDFDSACSLDIHGSLGCLESFRKSLYEKYKKEKEYKSSSCLNLFKIFEGDLYSYRIEDAKDWA